MCVGSAIAHVRGSAIAHVRGSAIAHVRGSAIAHVRGSAIAHVRGSAMAANHFCEDYTMSDSIVCMMTLINVERELVSEFKI